MDTMIQVLVGALTGAAAAGSHLGLTWRAAKRAVHQGRAAWVLLGMPARVVLVTGMLVLLGLWGLPALAAGLVAFVVAERIGTRVIQREDDRRGLKDDTDAS